MAPQKITPENAVAISQKIGKKSYCNSPYWLTENCSYEERNGETLVYVNDRILNETYLLFLPEKKENYTTKKISLATKEEVERIKKEGIAIKKTEPQGTEYFYRTKDLIEMKGQKYARLRKAVNQFKKNNYKILQVYPAQKVTDFIKNWAATKNLTKHTENARKLFEWDLDNCIKYVGLRKKLPTKRIYIEIDGKLAAFAFVHPLFPNQFVALQQKVDIKYKGLSRFLYHEKAKLYPEIEMFTVGTAAETAGLETFKEELHPAKKEEWQMIILE